jgi:hypothetical protein
LGYAVEDILASMVRDGTMDALFQKQGITYTASGLEYFSSTKQQ